MSSEESFVPCPFALRDYRCVLSEGHEERHVVVSLGERGAWFYDLGDPGVAPTIVGRQIREVSLTAALHVDLREPLTFREACAVWEYMQLVRRAR